MPYKCTVCGKIYLEGSDELKGIMRKGGCECGKKFLMYIRGVRDQDFGGLDSSKPVFESKVVVRDDSKVVEEPLIARVEDKKSLNWLDREFLRMREEGKSLNLGIETIRILEEGKYEIDVASLMRGKPIIVQTEEGVYFIDLAHAMRKK